MVGRCVCEHLARHYHGKVKWAMAARSRSKLESLKQELMEMDLDVKVFILCWIACESNCHDSIGSSVRRTCQS